MVEGKRQKARAEQQRVVDEYRASGQNVKDWCAAHDVKPDNLWRWLRRAKVETAEKQSTRWLQAIVAVGPTRLYDTGLTVQVGRAGIEVRQGFDPELLCNVVRALSTIC